MAFNFGEPISESNPLPITLEGVVPGGTSPTAADMISAFNSLAELNTDLSAPTTGAALATLIANSHKLVTVGRKSASSPDAEQDYEVVSSDPGADGVALGATGKWLKRRKKPIVDVGFYGDVWTDGTDITDYILAAFNANGSGFRYDVPPGNFVIRKQRLNLAGMSGVEIRPKYKRRTTLTVQNAIGSTTAGSSSIAVFTIGTDSVDIDIHGFNWTGTNGNDRVAYAVAGAKGIRLAHHRITKIALYRGQQSLGAGGVVVEDLLIEHCHGDGVAPQGGSQGDYILVGCTKGWTVRHCSGKLYSYGCTWWGGNSGTATSTEAGLNKLSGARNCRDGVVENCQFYDSGSVGAGYGSGCWGSMGYNLQIRNVRSERNGDVGIDLEGCRYCQVIGGYVADSAKGNLTVFFGSTAIKFIGVVSEFLDTNTWNDTGVGSAAGQSAHYRNYNDTNGGWISRWTEISGCTFRARMMSPNGTPCSIDDAGGTAGEYRIHDNQFINARLSFTALNTRFGTVRDNWFFQDVASTAAFNLMNFNLNGTLRYDNGTEPDIFDANAWPVINHQTPYSSHIDISGNRGLLLAVNFTGSRIARLTKSNNNARVTWTFRDNQFNGPGSAWTVGLNIVHAGDVAARTFAYVGDNILPPIPEAGTWPALTGGPLVIDDSAGTAYPALFLRTGPNTTFSGGLMGEWGTLRIPLTAAEIGAFSAFGSVTATASVTQDPVTKDVSAVTVTATMGDRKLVKYGSLAAATAGNFSVSQGRGHGEPGTGFRLPPFSVLQGRFVWADGTTNVFFSVRLMAINGGQYVLELVNLDTGAKGVPAQGATCYFLAPAVPG